MADDLREAAADMTTSERYAYARGMVRMYSLANEALTTALRDGGDPATIADARQRLTAQWNAGPGAFIDELTAGG